MSASSPPLLIPVPPPTGLARTALPRIASRTIAMEDHHAKIIGCSGSGETSAAVTASRIITQWAARRRQACEQMVLDLDRRDRDSELLALARLHAVSTMLDASFLRASENDGSGRRARSPERALVRRIAREWTTAPASQQSSSGGEGARGDQWLGESERERVRSVRERVRRASQGDGGDAHAEQRTARQRGSDPPRLRERRDVMTRMAMERQRELQGLSEHRSVSAFAHRNRIQSFLQGRFFRGGRPVHEDRTLSMATRELGQLRQSHHVARLREEVRSRTEDITNDQEPDSFRSMGAENSTADGEHHSSIGQVFRDDNHDLENATGNHEIQTFQSAEYQSVNAESAIPNGNDFDQENVHGYEDYSSDSGSSQQGSDQSGSSSSTPSENHVPQEAGTYGQPNELQWSREMSGSEEGEDGDGDDEWHVIDSQEAEPQWQSGRGFSPSTYNNWFGPPEDAVYGVELRELLRRRSVSNLLSSGFRESLDQLVQSYARRQEIDERQMPNTGPLNEDHAELGIDEPNRRNWSHRLAMHRPEFECDAIHVLREDLTGLQRGMTSMQQMLRACMEMQMEVQRSIKQEVSAALNRSISMQGWAEGMPDDASRWTLARKGTCCVCCDNQIDSLLYRCGHMCTCSKCASELLHGVGKCPLCRAPIVEVVRAYCIM